MAVANDDHPDWPFFPINRVVVGHYFHCDQPGWKPPIWLLLLGYTRYHAGKPHPSGRFRLLRNKGKKKKDNQEPLENQDNNAND